MAYKSPQAREYINTVRHITHELGVEQDAVVLSSGAMYLGAAAVDKTCRSPRDLDICVSPDNMARVRQRLGATSETRDASGHYISGRVGNISVDVGPTWGRLPHKAVRDWSQVTPEGLAFASLEDVKNYKQWRMQAMPNGDCAKKDAQDVQYIGALLGEFSQNSMGLACTAEAVFGNTDASKQAERLLTPELLKAPISEDDATLFHRIGGEGIRRMGLRYGTGLLEGPDFPGYRFEPVDPRFNEKALWWNTRRHGIDVGNDAELLTGELKMGGLACAAFHMAGDWHDVIQRGVIKDPTKRDGRDELMSAQELMEVLRSLGVARPVAFLAAYFIQGTQVTTEGAQVTGQAGVKLTSFPNKQAQLAALIGSSADMGKLYKGKYTGLGLFPQREGVYFPYTPDLSKPEVRKRLGGFLVGQHGFLAGYRFPLPEAERLFAKNSHHDYRSERLHLTEGLLRQHQVDRTPDNWWDFMEQTDPRSPKHRMLKPFL